MKKVLLGLAALLVSANLFAGEFVIKVGLNDNQNTKFTSEGKHFEGKSSHSYTFQTEYYHQLNDQVFLGGGIGYNTPLRVENVELVTLYPIYLSGKIKGSNNDFTPYAGLKLGWTVPRFIDLEEESSYDSYDDKSGLFLGANAGVEFKNNIILEVFYEKSTYKYTYTDFYYDKDTDTTFKTSRVGLNLGYKFGK